MGADTSALRGIDSLSHTLTNIENRLAQLEDVHLHHERSIASDNTALISGKRVVCQPHVHLLIGPILGLITHNSVRILVETDVDATLCFHVFLADELSMQARFQFEVELSVTAYLPKAVTITDLQPDTKYLVYIGGACYHDTILNYASVHTLSLNRDHNLNYITSYDSRLTQVIPGEPNLIDSLYDKVTHAETHHESIAAVLHVGNVVAVDPLVHSYCIELANSLCQDECIDETWQRQLNHIEQLIHDSYRKFLSDPKMRTIMRKCSNLFVAGSLEAVLETVSFLTVLEQESFDSIATKPKLSPEEEIKKAEELKRQKKLEKKKIKKRVTTDADNEDGDDSTAPGVASGESSVKNLKKRGEDIEGDSDNYSEDDFPMEKDYNVEDTDFSKEPENTAEVTSAPEPQAVAQSGKGKKKKNKEQRLEEEKRAKEAAAAAEFAKDPLNGALPSALATAEDVRKGHKKSIYAVKRRATNDREMHQAAASAVIRCARRVYWKYMRQLWDDNVEDYLDFDAQQETLLRSILATRRQVGLHRRLLHALNQSHLRCVREFGEEYQSADRLHKRCQEVSAELVRLESKLLTGLNQAVLLQSYGSSRLASNASAIRCGRSLLVLVDPAWSAIAPDGGILRVLSREVQLSDEFSAKLEAHLLDQQPVLHNELHAADQPPMSPSVQVPLDCVIVASSSMLLYSLPSLQNQGRVLEGSVPPDIPVNYRIASMDCKKFFHLLSRWKQFSPNRNVVVITPTLHRKSCVGRLMPLAAVRSQDSHLTTIKRMSNNLITEDNDMNASDDSHESWDFENSQLAALFLASRDATMISRPLLSENRKHQKLLNQQLQLIIKSGKPIDTTDRIVLDNFPDVAVDELKEIAIAIDNKSISSLRAYWQFSVVRSTTSVEKIGPNGKRFHELGKPSKVFCSQVFPMIRDCDKKLLRNVNSRINFGPLIGRITQTSVTILLESNESCYIEVKLIDQISGVQFANKQFAKENIMCSFYFDNLTPDRSYDVIIHDFVISNGDYQYVSTVDQDKSTTTSNLNSQQHEESLLLRRFQEYSLIHASFQTHKRLFISEDLENDLMIIEKLRSVAFDLEASRSEVSNKSIPIESSGPAAASNVAVAMALDSRPASPTVESAEDESHGINDSDQDECVFRVVVIGNCRPNLRSLIDTATIRENYDGFTNDNAVEIDQQLQLMIEDRENIEAGFHLSREVGDALSKPFNGIDLVLHCGNCIDWSFTIHRVLNHLSAAEKFLVLMSDTSYLEEPQSIESYTAHPSNLAAFQYNNYTNHSIQNHKVQYQKHMNLAEFELRTALRMHFSSSHFRDLLNHGSHVFIMSAVMSLLGAFQVNSLRLLMRELSTFCCEHLLAMIDKQQKFLENSLWQQCIGSSTRRKPNDPQFYRQGEIAIVGLSINNLLSQDNFGTRNDGYISNETFQQLESLLHPDDGSPEVNEVERALQTLIIVSPIPLLSSPLPFQLSGSPSPQFTVSELLRLLELLTRWLEEYLGREVIVVSTCPDLGSGLISRIYAEGIEDDNNENASQDHSSTSNARRGKKITQLCVGNFVGGVGDPDLPPSDELYSAKHRFVFEYESIMPQSHVGVVEIRDKQTDISKELSVHLISSEEFGDKSRRWNLLNEVKKNMVLMRRNDGESPETAFSTVISRSSTSIFLPQLWEIVRSHVQYFHINNETQVASESNVPGRILTQFSNNSLPKSIDENALYILRGTTVLFQKYEALWKQSHTLLKQMKCFNVPFRHGCEFVRAFLSLFSFVTSQMADLDGDSYRTNIEVHEVFHIPSSYVIKKVMNKFVSGYLSIERASTNFQDAFLPLKLKTMRDQSIDVVIANLISDHEYYLKFMRQVLEVQVLFEYFSHILGVFDVDFDAN